MTRQATLASLQSTIKGLERHELEATRREYVSSGFAALDERLPHGGLPLGALIEILADAGSGALTLALLLARKAIERAAAWGVVAGARGEGLGVRTERSADLTPNPSPLAPAFHPPSAAHLGLDIRKLILVRPSERQAGWCFTQLLRSQDVGASFFCTARGENMLFRRFQLAVERGGGQGFIIRPPSALRKPCWAAVRLQIMHGTEGVRGQGSVVRTDGGAPDENVVLELEQGRAVRVAILHARK